MKRSGIEGEWVFLSAMFVGGCVLTAAHYGFGVFLMILSFVIAMIAASNG